MEAYKEEVLQRTSDHVRDALAGEATGHDWWHAERVRRTARQIASSEGADVFVVELASLLHDLEDYKFSGSTEAGPAVAREWLAKLDVDEEMISRVVQIIAGISFLGANVPDVDLSIEGACVMDADRLDALGAVGIARVFAYGGYVRRPIHDPHLQPVLHGEATLYRESVGTSINHFHEKLLLLVDRLITPTGQALGRARHHYMLEFLANFDREWNGRPSGDAGEGMDRSGHFGE
jgi:uncharacterized protein